METAAPCTGCDPGNPGGHLPPPRCLDVGNGEAFTVGTAEDFRAAADYLARHYPDAPPESSPGSFFTGPLNGIKLITEVMDHAPQTLTQREHKVLMILAEDAIDGQPGELDDRGREKRVIRQRIDSAKMLRRARCSRTQLYSVVSSLIAKGCLERVTIGGGGHPAVYRITALGTQSCVPENRTQAPVDNPESCVPENSTQTGAASRNPGHSASRFAKDTGPIRQPQGTLNGARGSAGLIAPEAAEQVRDRNGATPSQSLRDHDGPEDQLLTINSNLTR